MITSGAYWLLVLLGVPLFWSLPRRAREAFLALGSIAFLASLAPLACLGFLAWSLCFYLVAPLTRGGERRWLQVGLILALLGYLAFFKYAPPLVEALVGWTRLTRLVVPLGLSYFTFKLIHYLLEVSRRTIRDRSLWRFLGWVFLFPTFSAGPIERFDHYLANAEERLTRSALVEGLMRVAVGLVKKFVLVAIVLEDLVSAPGGVPADVTTSLGAWRACITTFLIVYLDFSAYSDIAIGTSRLFGLRIMENFRWPILAPDIGEFWRRWHMTLVGWCRTYVYMPTIGVTRNPYVAVYAFCLAVGLWHAGTLGYVLWGLYHATGIVVFQTWKRLKARHRLRLPAALGPGHRAWDLLGMAATVLFVSASFSFTGRAPMEGLRMLARLLFLDLAPAAQL